MKHILFALAIPALAFLTACGGDSGEDSAPKPTLSFQTGPGYTFSNAKASVDSVLNIGIIAKSNDSKLSRITISLSTNGGTPGVIFDTTITSNSATFNYPYKVKGTVGDALKLTVKATDANGTATEQSLNIEISVPVFFVDGPTNQFVWNLQGAKEGAYDLRNGLNKTLADAPGDKDIIDGTPSTAVFSKSWTSGNGSNFVKVSTNDWNLATNSTFLYDLWKANAANAKPTVTDIKTGDIIMVKSGQSIPFSFYIIKITEVKETATDNLDYIKFDYRGQVI